MKNTIKLYLSFFTFIIIIIGNSFSINAQNYIGAKAAFQSSKVLINGLGVTNFIDVDYLNTYSTGIVYQIDLGGNFFFRPEASFSQKGFDARLSTNVKVYGDYDLPIGVGAKTVFQYIETPLNLGYSFNLGNAYLQVYGGPTIGYATKAVIKPYTSAILVRINLPKQKLNLSSKNYSRIELGANIGSTLAIPIRTGNILLDVRYNRSFTNFLHDPIIDVHIYNRSIALGLGYIHKI